MIANRTGRRCASLAFTALMAVVLQATTAFAQNTSSLSGFVYIDRNNDGQLAFADEPLPELVLPNINIELYSIEVGPPTLLATTQTNAIGQYLFDNLAPGTYMLRQLQPVEFVDGLDTLGSIRNMMGQLNPVGSAVGTMSNNQFADIILPAGAHGTLYNFGELGMAPGYVTKRDLLGSAPPPNYAPQIPEPATALLAIIGSLAVMALRRGA